MERDEMEITAPRIAVPVHSVIVHMPSERCRNMKKRCLAGGEPCPHELDQTPNR
jgi:hypothetical protein